MTVHMHMLFLDGAYSFSKHGASFHRARRPTDTELTQLLDRLSRRIVRVLERRDLLIATKRLSVNGRGRVVYQYKQPFRDGSTHVVLDPLDYIARLAALVPRPQIDQFVIRASIWRTTPRTFVTGTLDIASTS